MSEPTVRVVLGLVLLLPGMTVATTPTDLTVSDAAAQPPEQVVDGEELGSTDERTTAPDRTGGRGRMGRPSGTPASGQHSGATLNITYTFQRLPERPGIVGVTMRLPETPAADGASIDFREGRGVTVVNTTNVERVGTSYEWTGDRPAEIAYRLPINWTYTGNRAASWTLVQYREPSIASIDAGASVEVRRRARLAGAGYVGSTAVLLGRHTVSQRRAGEQRIRVVVPDNVTLRDDPRSTVSALAAAARSLSIGGRDEVVHVFVTPKIRTEAEQLFQPGFAIGDDTLLIDAESEFDVWTHEYVHSRQEFPDTGRIRWLTEGSAEYYGWLLTVEQGYDSWSPLREVFVEATTDDSVLADPETWRGETEYNKGALVLGVLDHEIRVATDGERTLQDVFRRLNADTDPTLDTFVKTVGEVGGPDAGGLARVAVRKTSDGTTDRVKTPWVGWLRPQVTVTRNETFQFSRPGTYETAWGDRQIVVRVARDRGTASVIGVNATLNRSSEQVIVDAIVRNDADRPTFVELPVSLDGQRLRTVRAVVDGSATQTVTVSLNSSRQAPYDVGIGDARATVGQQDGAGRPDTGPDIPFLLVLGTLALVGGLAAWTIVFRR